MTTSSCKSAQCCDEGLSRQVRYQFKMNCFHRQTHEQTDIGLQNSWLLYVSVFDLEEACIIDPNSREDRPSGNLLNRELAKQLTSWFHRVTSARDALSCNTVLTVLRRSITWNCRLREDIRSVGPACMRRTCSPLMMSLVSG